MESLGSMGFSGLQVLRLAAVTDLLNCRWRFGGPIPPISLQQCWGGLLFGFLLFP